VYIDEKEHKYFDRDGNDVIYRCPISFSQAALGEEVEVPTLGGKAKMEVPAGTQSGKVFRMRGKGIPDVNGRGVGDQLVQVFLWTPDSLSPRERELFEELGDIEIKRAASEGKSFFAKMVEAFGG
jgi:molecular chaperone DnaJ